MKTHDEYDWAQYTPEYEQQLSDIKQKDKQDFFITRFDAAADEIVFYDNLHPNWMEIYSTAWRLRPKRIVEAGCGACYHLKNLRFILPDSEIYGIDLLESQIEFGKKFSDLPDDIANNLMICDLTDPSLFISPSLYDFIFTNAVIMHLSTDHAMNFLKNLWRMRPASILLVEGVKNHENWFEMVTTIFEGYEATITDKYINYGILLTQK